ncbi:helix-turn-helix domain-containing protein [Listeria booriae]|uniref:helix-turn-helix domain-containing protein n=1 Tax=Listeria booriae TaxID=1552123 RepID=UPI001625C6E5|nr:Rgg/GadR/MutR family transcriptional regulator [Listeria booriae]MBC1284860.1 helix-turn-helix domain-containing protein [Listeria booriae]
MEKTKLLDKKKLGDTLKQIRLNQGLKQKDIYDEQGFLPRSTFQKIERNESIPSYDRLQYIAKKMNTTINEIEFLQYNKSLSEAEMLIYDFRRLRNSMYVDRVVDLKKRMELFLEHNYDGRIIELIAILKAFILIEETQDFEAPREIVEFIWKRLEKQDEWQHFDMIILSNIFFIFPLDTARAIIERLINQLEAYKYFLNTQRLQLSILINVTNFLKYHKKILESEEYIIKSIELAIQIENLTYESVARYRYAELLLVKGNKEQATKIANDVFTILELGDKKEYLKELTNDWAKLNENIEDYT